jgi:glycosyltransferase involved in cell wall biosynthesis
MQSVRKTANTRTDAQASHSPIALSFVIPAHNEAQRIEACLRSIEEILPRAGACPTEIIVVNNASTDRTREAAKRVKGVRVVDEPVKGLTRARARGLTEARGELVAYLDADTRLHPRWFEVLEREFSRERGIVCLSGPFRYYDLPPFKNLVAQFFWWASAPLMYWLVGYMVLGANFVARREALLRVGGFDTSIEFYGEDTDIARRLSEVGKVTFRMDFFILGSGRRLLKEGLLRTFARYAVNFIWGVVAKKPFTKTHTDIR